MGQPAEILRGPIFRTGNLQSLEPKHGWVHEEPCDPLKEALQAAGASCVELYDIRISEADVHMECPLVDRKFTVWAFHVRGSATTGPLRGSA